MTSTIRLRPIVSLLAVAMLVAACTTAGGPTEAPGTEPAGTEAPGTEPPTGGDTYRIGYSNGGGVGNGFREEQVCTAKAEASASGRVSELITIHRNTDPAGQLSDIRDLIAADVDAIVFNPNDPNALNPALEEANAAGIRTVSVDAFVTNPDTYNLYNNQVDYAYLGSKWLFEQLGGEGTVWYMRGLAGHPADDDRHIGGSPPCETIVKTRPRGLTARFGVGASCQLNADPAKDWNQGSSCG